MVPPQKSDIMIRIRQKLIECEEAIDELDMFSDETENYYIPEALEIAKGYIMLTMKNLEEKMIKCNIGEDIEDSD